MYIASSKEIFEVICSLFLQFCSSQFYVDLQLQLENDFMKSIQAEVDWFHLFIVFYLRTDWCYV